MGGKVKGLDLLRCSGKRTYVTVTKKEQGPQISQCKRREACKKVLEQELEPKPEREARLQQA